VSQSTEYPADEVRAQPSFHADGAWSQLLERIFETLSPDLTAEGDVPIDVKPDQVKNLLADVDADDRHGRCAGSHFRLRPASPVHRASRQRLAQPRESSGPSHYRFTLMLPDRLSSTFSALSDPTRRAILARLMSGKASVTELAEPFRMSLPSAGRRHC
jgi:hypothetical protein